MVIPVSSQDYVVPAKSVNGVSVTSCNRRVTGLDQGQNSGSGKRCIPVIAQYDIASSSAVDRIISCSAQNHIGSVASSNLIITTRSRINRCDIDQNSSCVEHPMTIVAQDDIVAATGGN